MYRVRRKYVENTLGSYISLNTEAIQISNLSPIEGSVLSNFHYNDFYSMFLLSKHQVNRSNLLDLLHEDMVSNETSMSLVYFWKVLYYIKHHESLKNTSRSDYPAKIDFDELQIGTRTGPKLTWIRFIDVQTNIKATISRIKK